METRVAEAQILICSFPQTEGNCSWTSTCASYVSNNRRKNCLRNGSFLMFEIHTHTNPLLGAVHKSNEFYSTPAQAKSQIGSGQAPKTATPLGQC